MKSKLQSHLTFVLIAAVAILTVFNSYQLFEMSGGKITSSSTFKGSTINVKAGGDTTKAVIAALIPTGVPTYGDSIGVTYDDPVNGVKILANLDRSIQNSALSAEEKERFIAINTQISCEFCCGAPAVVDNTGRSLCGCAHAAAFRGLSKYMLQNYPDATNDEILMELTRWKSLFYPRNMVEKGVAAVDNGLELTPQVLNDMNLLKKIKSNNIDSIGELPAMVGGC